MNRHKYSKIVFILALSSGLISCSTHTGETLADDKNISAHSSTASQQDPSSASDLLHTQKDHLTKMYTRAIEEFIKAAYQKDKSTFDTLYFGKHVYGQPDDFPDIELPETIEKTHIRLVAPEVGQKKQLERKSLVYVNMMGWIEQEKAEFILVVFTNGGEHQYNYFIHFNYDTSTKSFVLSNIEFENYVHLNGQKPQHTEIFKDGVYVLEK